MILKRFLCLLLVLVVGIGLISCDNGTPVDDPSDVADTTPEYTLENIRQNIGEYTIIRSDVADTVIKDASLSLRGALMDVASLEKMELTTDWLDNGQVVDPSVPEILLGQTNREESEQAAAMLGDKDYLITQIGSKICIVGVHDYAVAKGVNQFLATYFGYDVPDAYHNVKHYGAVGDGRIDDTKAFEAAIAAAQKDGLPVFVPAGEYLITETLLLESVTLYGYSSGAWTADKSDLPVVYHTNLEEPLFHVASGSLSGLHIVVQGVTKDTTKEQAVETVRMSQAGARVSDMKITNPFIGISTYYDPSKEGNPGRCHIENIFIVQAYHTGVFVHGTYDVATLLNIEVWNPGDISCPTAFRLGKNDDLRATNLFAFNAVVGFRFEETVSDTAGNKGGCWGSFVNCSTDLCQRGIQVSSGHHSVTFVGGTYWNHFFGLEVREETASSTRVTLNGCEIKSNGMGQPISVAGGQMITVSGCNLTRNADGHNTEVVLISGGQAVTISGNTMCAKDTAVNITSAFKGAANVSGNTILCAKTSGAITNFSKSSAVLTDGNAVVYNVDFSEDK